MRDKEVVIMGSTNPWYEAVCLAEMAASCTTIEYNTVSWDHEGLRTLTVDEYKTMEEKPTFDIALSISSFEHDGLGRYGDPLDPDGDLKTMDHMRQVLKPNGYLLLAVPVGLDTITWNTHRTYGRVRLTALMRHWSLVAHVGFDWELFKLGQYQNDWQPIFVLKNDGGVAN